MILACLVWFNAPSRSAAEQLGRSVFRSSVTLVHRHLAVINGEERRNAGLDKDAFEVFEDGVRQDLEFFAPRQVPLDLAILLDTSNSMLSKIPHAQEAAVGFVRSLRAGDRGSVIEFNDLVRVRADFTGEVGELEAAIRSAVAHGDTSLYTAIYVALKTLKPSTSESGELRRQAMLVVSDGSDTTSLVQFEDVLELAQRTGVSVYTVSLTSEHARVRMQTPGSLDAQARYDMKTLARETGAHAFFPLRIEQLGDVYAEIVDELSHQYTLGYVSTNSRRDGTFRRVVVRVLTPPGVRARTRSGYFTPRETSVNLAPWR